MVARQDQFIAAGIVDGDGEHAVQFLERFHADGMIEIENDFGVAAGLEDIAVADQGIAQRDVIVDLTGEHQRDAIIGVHGLMPAGQIDQAETAVGETHAGRDMGAAVVGAAMEDGIVHLPQQMFYFGRGLVRPDANNAAHSRTPGTPDPGSGRPHGQTLGSGPANIKIFVNQPAARR